MRRRQSVGSTLILAGVALGIAWAIGRIPYPFAPVVALFMFLTGASFFGKVSGFAEKIRPFVGKKVRVQVWGSSWPDHPGFELAVHAVRALGPALHIYLCPLPDGSPVYLKVAQPRGATLGETGVEIAEAKYVQLAGRKIKKVEGEIALLIVINGSS